MGSITWGFFVVTQSQLTKHACTGPGPCLVLSTFCIFTHFILWGLNELVCVNSLKLCLLHNKHSENLSWQYLPCFYCASFSTSSSSSHYLYYYSHLQKRKLGHNEVKLLVQRFDFPGIQQPIVTKSRDGNAWPWDFHLPSNEILSP